VSIEQIPMGLAIGTPLSQNPLFLADAYQFPVHLGQLPRRRG
jgi:hypothetical protein